MTSRPAGDRPGHQPPPVPAGPYDYELRKLIELLDGLYNKTGKNSTARPATPEDLDAATVDPADLPRIDPGDATP